MKLNDVISNYEIIKAEEIEGVIFDLIGAEGPFAGRYGDFIRFLVRTESGEVRALLLAYTPGQREQLLRYFSPDENGEIIDGVTLKKLTLDSGKTFWSFEDAADQ